MVHFQLKDRNTHQSKYPFREIKTSDAWFYLMLID